MQMGDDYPENNNAITKVNLSDHNQDKNPFKIEELYFKFMLSD